MRVINQGDVLLKNRYTRMVVPVSSCSVAIELDCGHYAKTSAAKTEAQATCASKDVNSRKRSTN